jgi:hypothetical protein
MTYLCQKSELLRLEGEEGKEGVAGYNLGMEKMRGKLPFEIKEVRAKGILSKCGIPGIDLVVNPFYGIW